MTTLTLARVGRTSLGFGLLIGLAVSTLALTPSSAAPLRRPSAVVRTDTPPTGTGVIRGRVMLGNRAQAGVAVTLVAVPTTGNDFNVQTTTDPSGAYAFTRLPVGQTWGYSVSARYEGALFSTDQITLTGNESASLNTYVFTPTTVPDAISTQAVAIWIDYNGRTMSVQQDIQYANTAKTAYITTNKIKVDNVITPTAVTLTLAPGFKNLQYLGRFQTCCSATNGTQWLNTRPLAPGANRGTVRYEVGITNDLSFPMQFPTKSIAILVPTKVTATIPNFSKVGTKTDSGTTYNVYQGGPIAAGGVVTVHVGNPPRNWTLIVVIIGAVALVVALIAWFVLARRNKKRRAEEEAAIAAAEAKPKDKKKPAQATPATPDAASAPPTPATPPTAASTPTKQLSWSDLADQLARLDLAYESGQLTDAATYAKLREGLVQKLIAAQPPEQ